MRAAIWARVSTEDQDTEIQVRQLRDWAAALGYKVTERYALNDSACLGGKERRVPGEAKAPQHGAASRGPARLNGDVPSTGVSTMAQLIDLNARSFRKEFTGEVIAPGC